jgi:cysteine desulfuration protein SufE
MLSTGTPMTIDQAQRDLIEEFQFFDNWMDRYQYLIDLGRKLPPFPAEFRKEQYLLKGCQSQVWLISRRADSRLHFEAISDSAIVSGLIALLMRVYNDRTPAEILAAPPEFIKAIGLEEHLSPTRSNGLRAMIDAIRGRAREAVGGARTS